MDIKEIESIVRKTADEYKNTGEVKIGVSQRHIHLSREHLDILFYVQIAIYLLSSESNRACILPFNKA